MISEWSSVEEHVNNDIVKMLMKMKIPKKIIILSLVIGHHAKIYKFTHGMRLREHISRKPIIS